MDDKVVMQEQDERGGAGAPIVISKWIIVMGRLARRRGGEHESTR
jgi:hypothetical protein